MVISKLSISPLIEAIRILEPIRFEELTIYPLVGPSRVGPSYLTLDEALRSGSFKVSEVSTGGQVPELKVENRGEARVFILDGEILEGGKQSRVLNTSVLVGAHSETVIPVSCVESGRWSYRRHGFTSPSYAHSKMRAMKTRMVADAMIQGAGHGTDQEALWKEVDHLLLSSEAISPTQEFLAGAEATRSQREKFLREVRLPDGASGIAVAYGPRLLSVDLFDRAETLGKLWPKLTSGIVLDLYREKEGKLKEAPPDLNSVLRRAGSLKWDLEPAVVLGEDLRLREKDLVGSGLSLDGHILQLSLFPEN